ncbi:MAG: dienelactone hydrolase family protein [Pseudolabrys sp.]|nr:dienelactone hydrolase family protein [Pseudolabrys sp.]
MGKTLTLTTDDNHTLGAYRADPAGKPKGGIVVVQEIFGVNHHIRAVCDKFASLGYVAIAPAVFDRFERNFESGYSPDEVAHARSFIGNVHFGKMMHDLTAAKNEIKDAGPFGVVGYCLGGTAAYLAACKLEGISAAVGYYGGGVVKFIDEQPACPVQLHFGSEDHGIPLTDVETIKAKRPELDVYVYEGAAHGFNCDERASYHKDAAALAWTRTEAFLAKNVK